NYRFPGQYFDSETNLRHNLLRDYDAVVGRFVQSDPKGLKGGLNPFSYVNASPTTSIDPHGLDVWDCTRPLEYGGLPLTAGMPFRGNLYHEFLCVTESSNAMSVC